ncbi:MAG: pyridoxamine 5'-phosphate oxidase family protein [Haloarculaceae archaeon]
MDHISYVETVGMDERELAEHLHGVEAGVLALADDGDAYAVPVSFRYDDGRLLLRLTDDGDSEKLAFARATDSATFVAFGSDGNDSWSVLARGPLVELDDDETAALLEAPDAFGSVRVFDEAVTELEIRVFELEAEAITGRRTAGVDAWRAVVGTGR